jgi:hypothetical protein
VFYIGFVVQRVPNLFLISDVSAGNKAQCRELLVDNACFIPFLFHMYFFIHELDYELILGLGCGFDDREIGIRFPIGASRLVLGGYSA